jgi:hypothetical protein
MKKYEIDHEIYSNHAKNDRLFCPIISAAHLQNLVAMAETQDPLLAAVTSRNAMQLACILRSDSELRAFFDAALVRRLRHFDSQRQLTDDL